MKAIWITRFGPPEVLRVQEAPDPKPGPGEVKIRVRFSGINFSDILGRMGFYGDVARYLPNPPYGPDPPFVPGYEVSGHIEELGPGVSGRSVGERVLALRVFGAYADTVCVPAENAVSLPANMSSQEGAALPVTYLTAYHALYYMTHINPEERVLVHVAAGGVGTAAIQLCKIAGATIYGTTSTSKMDFLRAQGIHPIDYTRPGFESEIERLAAGEGFHIILDPIGGDSVRRSYNWLAPNGRLLVYGFSSFAPGKTRSALKTAWNFFRAPRFDTQAFVQQQRGILGIGISPVFNTPTGRREMAALLALYEEGKIKPHIGKVFPFEKAVEAHHYIQDRKNIGKVLLEA